MRFNKLRNRCYQALLDRGVIKAKTERGEFINKLDEELNEIKEVYYKCQSQSRYVEELTDLATVCITQIHHLGRDFEEEFEKGVLKTKKEQL